MKSDPTRPLDDNQIAMAVHLCFKNAEKLEINATLLEENGSEERAVALLVLALEELAKIPLVFEAVRFAPEQTKAWRWFWRAFRNHSYKQGVWSHYGKMLKEANTSDA
ncbi:MAG: AbiV family abortive infection protein [Acidobacteriaceae bacterium]